MSEQLTALARPFKGSLVHPPADGKFGSYVSHDAVTQKLLAVLGPFSYRIVQTIRDDAEGLITGCIAELTVTIDGREVTVQEAGDVENPKSKKTNGARMKDASSDAIKRCAMRLGVGLHLWADEFFLYEALKTRVGVTGMGEQPGTVTAGDPGLGSNTAGILDDSAAEAEDRSRYGG